MKKKMKTIDVSGSTPSHPYTYFCQCEHVLDLYENEIVVKTTLGGDHTHEVRIRAFPVSFEGIKDVYSILYDKGCNAIRADITLTKIREIYGFPPCPDCKKEHAFIIGDRCWYCRGGN